MNNLLIGARFADPNGNDRAGETYVIFGSTDGLPSGGVIDLSALNSSAVTGTAGLVINDIDGRDYSGVSVSAAGDINGDGVDDLLIGAPFADPNDNDNAGETYVIFGVNSSNSIIDVPTLSSWRLGCS